MNYISTRNSSKWFNFKDVFIKGLADDGGLYIPKSLHRYNQEDLNNFEDLQYTELAKLSTFGEYKEEEWTHEDVLNYVTYHT